MTIASYFLGFVLSSLPAFAFHLWKGGKFGKILLYLLFSWAGFWGAQILGTSLDWEFFAIGSLLVGFDLLGAILFLFLGHWLSLVGTDEG